VKRRIGVFVLAVSLCACQTPLTLDSLPWPLTPKPEPASAPPSEQVPTAALPPPEGLSTISGELRAIPLHWDPLLISGVAGYVMERSQQRAGPYRQVADLDGRANTAWVDRGAGLVAAATTGEPATLGDGETYFYRVRPRTLQDVLGEEASAVVTGTTAVLPDPPEELCAYSHQPRSVPLSWRASADPNVDSYVIERSPTSQGPFESIQELEGRFETVYVDLDLGDLRVFHYRVRSVNRAGGRGEPSDPERAVTKGEPLPPVGLRVVAQGLGANELTWDANVENDLIGYQLFRQRAASDTQEPVGSLSESVTRVVDREVGAGESVHYTLRALDSDGLESDTSGPLEVTSVDYEIESEVGPEGVVLRWRDRSNEGWVHARILLIRALGPTDLGTTSGALFVHTGVTPGNLYRYRIVLETAAGRRAPESRLVEVQVTAR
jgi:hypothetical protein